MSKMKVLVCREMYYSVKGVILVKGGLKKKGGGF